MCSFSIFYTVAAFPGSICIMYVLIEIAPVLQRQISLKTRSEKKAQSGFLTGYGDFKRT